MEFWKDPWFKELVRQVIIAVLVAMLSVLGYDQAVAKPRTDRAVEQAIHNDLQR